MEWTRDGLESAGFEGFLPLATLDPTKVRSEPGVYVVLREQAGAPTFLSVSAAGHFKDKDPTVPLNRLEAAWVDGAAVLYVGKASGGRRGRRGLRTRLDEYRRHGSGKPVGHWGGRYIWQLTDRVELLVAWTPIPGEDPEVEESRLIADFKDRYGAKPFANRKLGKLLA
jgi:hypothetical protein